MMVSPSATVKEAPRSNVAEYPRLAIHKPTPTRDHGAYGAGPRAEQKSINTGLSASDSGTRDELILANLSLVDVIVRRLPYEIIRHWGTDDLRSFGRLGLIDAAGRWRVATAETSFATFAVSRIRGSIYDELRRLDWLPRTLRRRVIEYRDTEDELRASRGRTPSQRDVVTEMGLQGTKQALSLSTALRRQQIDFLQDPYTDDDEHNKMDYLVSADDPEDTVLRNFEHAKLQAAIKELPIRQRNILSYRFLSGMTQQQVGDMLGVSNTRICQLEGEGLRALRRLLTADGAA
jgi:RNA polymerase sigma factor FliA